MSKFAAHLWALFCIAVWGSSFVLTTILMDSFSPAKLVFYRFLIGYLVILFCYPKQEKMDLKDRLGMLLFGFIGVTVYYLCESYALKYTYAANVSILVTFAPLITVFLSYLLNRSERINRRFILGSFIALLGVALVIFNGKVVLQLNPIGDLLALGAAFCWAIYSILLRHYAKHYSELFLTRQILLNGCLTLMPLAVFDSNPWNLLALFELKNLFALILLGVLASGACYVLWNIANVKIGIVAANAYVYVSPFVTLITAYLFLNQPVTPMSLFGCILIIGGVAIYEGALFK